MDLQAGHTSHVAELVYGRTVEQGPWGFSTKQDQFRKISVLWHRLWNFSSYDENSLIQPPSYEAEQQELRLLRLQRLQQVDLYGQLRQLLRDPNAEFKGKQEEVLKAIIQGSTPVLYVAGTGTGKSLTFLLPAYCTPDGVTVVITPFVALQEDLRQRCISLAIQCEVWSVDRAPTASVVLVTPESFVTPAFTSYINRLSVRQRLDRVVLDECHTVLDSSYEFRPQLRNIGSFLQSTGAQKVFLTATLPPRDELEFQTLLHIEQERLITIRCSTIRANIQYSVRKANSTAEEDALGIQLARETTRHREGTTSRTKVIIYCQTVDRTTEIARKLGCKAYYSKADNNPAKNTIIQDWITTGGAIVATSALGAGIDIADIRLVIHIGLPRSLRDFVQESGRAGRDGLPSQSVVICREASASTTTTTTAVLPSQKWIGPEKEDILQYVQKSVCCRRTILSRVIDGRYDRTKCEEGEEKCDLCITHLRPTSGFSRLQKPQASSNTSTPTGNTQISSNLRIMEATIRQGQQNEINRTRETQGDIAKFKDLLEFYSYNCVICYNQAEEQSYDHEFCGKTVVITDSDDENDEEIDIQAGYYTIKDMVGRNQRLPRFWGCYFCGVPQSLCKKWELTREGGYRMDRSATCSYDGVIMQVVGYYYSMQLIDNRILDKAKEIARNCGISVRNGLKLEDFVRLRIRWGTLEANGLCILFFVCCKYIAK